MVFQLGLEGWQNFERENRIRKFPGRRHVMNKDTEVRREKMGGKNNFVFFKI